jgi:formate-dependent nitrite reductase membrane component NrfD
MADRSPADREANLDRLREDAARQSSPLRPIAGYYGRPVLKPAVWTWEVPIYLFIGGAAGVSAVIAWVANLTGDGAIAADARIFAAAGAGVSPLLLISDLGRPARFLYMLRIFKPQSPMSVGAWTIVLFTMAIFGSLIGHWTPELAGSPVIALVDATAALSGLLLATYPGVLIGATAIPVWSRYVRVLPWHFAASSLGAAASLLELAGHRSPALNTIAMSGAAFVTAVALQFEFRKDRVTLPLVTGTSGLMTRLGDALSGPIPLVLRLISGAVPAARLTGAIMAVVGSLLTRFGWIAAGRRSVQDPQLVLDGGAR